MANAIPAICSKTMALPATYSRDQKVTVLPFTRQGQGEDVVIGRIETGQFIAVPAGAVEILDHLGHGATIGEAQDRYQASYGEIPDLEDFLAGLQQRGFVRPFESGAESSKPNAARKGQFARISQALAQRLFGRQVLIASTIVIGLALAVVALDPALLVRPNALYFRSYRGLSLLALFLWSVATVFVHELGHLVAARAVGVPARMSIGHRLWVLVAQTDLTGLWAVPQRQRYLPLLAGPLIDLFSWALISLFLAAQKSGWIMLPIPLLRFAQAVAFSYLMRLLWQCFFFVRTDFYYVLITLFGCVNLMHDTEIFLRNRMARALPWMSAIAEGSLPGAEARAVRIYAPFYVAGRILAFWSLFFITLPVLGRYLTTISTFVRTGYDRGPTIFLDGLLTSLLVVGPMGTGIFVWLRSLFSRRRTTHEDQKRTLRSEHLQDSNRRR